MRNFSRSIICLFACLALPFGSALRAKAARHDAPAAFSDDQWPPDRFLLRGPALHRRERRRTRAPPDERSRLHFVPAFLGRWHAARVHFAVRRQHRGLRHACGRRRTETPDDDRDARARRHFRSDGPEQHRDDVGKHQAAGRFPFAHEVVQFVHRLALFTVGLDAELPQQLPVPRGGFTSFSPDDSKMAFNRVFREFRTWKHYRGGMADDVWIFDFKTGTTREPDQ